MKQVHRVGVWLDISSWVSYVIIYWICFIKKQKQSFGKRNFELGDPTLGLGSYFENSRHRAKRIETFCKQLVALGYNRALCDANEKERRRNLPLFSRISLNKGEEVNNNIKTSRMGSLTFWICCLVFGSLLFVFVSRGVTHNWGERPEYLVSTSPFLLLLCFFSN